MAQELEDEIKDRLPTKTLSRITGVHDSSTSRVRVFKTDDENVNLFVKISDRIDAGIMFDGELESLKHINATNTIRAPKEYFAFHNYDRKGTSAIVVEYLDIEALDDKTGEQLGRDLASLHTYNHKVLRFNDKASKWIGKRPPSARICVAKNEEDVEDEEEETLSFAKHSLKIDNKPGGNSIPPSSASDRFVPNQNVNPISDFGFDVPTSCGVLPQVNEWTSDWVSFFARYRLELPINAILSDHGDRELIQQWSHLQLKVDKFFADLSFKDGVDDSETIIPALLHGDLWSQNAARIKTDSDDWLPVVFDPSSFYGHSEYDFGIVRMFRGFPASFEQGYFEVMPKRKLFEQRNLLYQLFHHLNHWRQFGFGYRASSLRMIKLILETKL